MAAPHFSDQLAAMRAHSKRKTTIGSKVNPRFLRNIRKANFKSCQNASIRAVRTSDLTVNYFALPNQAALIADDRITTLFVGFIFQQNVISLAVRCHVETDRPSRQDLRRLRKTHVPTLRHVLYSLFLLLVRRVEGLKDEMILTTKNLAGEKHIPTGKGSVFESVSVFTRVDGAQRIRLACSSSEDCAEAPCPR
jgi:hypothetical protein